MRKWRVNLGMELTECNHHISHISRCSAIGQLLKVAFDNVGACAGVLHQS